MTVSQELISDEVLRRDLVDVATEAFHNHLAKKDEHLWYPDLIVPVEPLNERLVLPPALQSAIFVNGRTEDNLPHYAGEFRQLFGLEDVYGEWSGRWDWEEGLHVRGIDYFERYARLFQSQFLEDARREQISGGIIPHLGSFGKGIIYATFQEEDTRIAHVRVSRGLSGISEVGTSLFSNIAGDEGRHRDFNLALATELRQRYPDEFAICFYSVIKHFDMPGTGIPGYKQHAKVIEAAGLFTARDVAKTILKYAKDPFDIETLDDDIKTEAAKEVVSRIHGKLKAYSRIAKMVPSERDPDMKSGVTWLNGVAILEAAA